MTEYPSGIYVRSSKSPRGTAETLVQLGVSLTWLFATQHLIKAEKSRTEKHSKIYARMY